MSRTGLFHILCISCVRCRLRWGEGRLKAEAMAVNAPETPWHTGMELHIARRNARWTAAQLAAAIGVDMKTIYRWESAKEKAEPTISQWRAIAKCLNAPWLLTGSGAIISQGDNYRQSPYAHLELVADPYQQYLPGFEPPLPE